MESNQAKVVSNLPANQQQQLATQTQFLSVEGLTQTNFYRNLPAEEREMALASVYEKIRTIPDDEFLFLIDGLIAKTHLNCGMKSDLEQVNSTIDELCEDLKKYNSSITFKEIELAFRNGWKGFYGEYFGLNNKTYFQWVNAYAYGEKRLRITNMMLKEKEKQSMKPEISEEEKNRIIRDGVLACFENFKSTGVIHDAGNVSYNYLDKMGLITFTKQVKDDIVAKTRERMINSSLMEMANTGNVRNIKEVKVIVDELKKGMPTSLITESKKEALKLFFQNLIEIDEDLKERI